MRRPVDLEALVLEGRRSRYQAAPVVLSPSISASLIGEAPRAEVKAQADATADLYLYGTIGGWFGKSAEQVIDDIKALPASTKKLRVHIRSEGGNVFDGLAIYNTLLRHPADVETIVESLAASIASVIALAGKRVTMEPAALFMVHDPHAMAFGEAKDMREMADLLDKVTDVLTDVYVARTDETRRQIRAWMTATTWFKASEAKSAGFVDFIAEVPPREKPQPEPEPEPEPEPAPSARNGHALRDRAAAIVAEYEYLTTRNGGHPLDLLSVWPAPEDGRCERGGETGRALVKDHDHAKKTQNFRGHVCHPCNALIRSHEQDPARARVRDAGAYWITQAFFAQAMVRRTTQPALPFPSLNPTEGA